MKRGEAFFSYCYSVELIFFLSFFFNGDWKDTFYPMNKIWHVKNKKKTFIRKIESEGIYLYHFSNEIRFGNLKFLFLYFLYW